MTSWQQIEKTVLVGVARLSVQARPDTCDGTEVGEEQDRNGHGTADCWAVWSGDPQLS